MPTFTPPTELSTPSLEASSSGLQARLFRFYGPQSRGVNVWVMPDGTVTRSQPQLLSNPDPANHANDVSAPRLTFYGGHTYHVSEADAALLQAAGYTVNPGDDTASYGDARYGIAVYGNPF